MKNLWLSLTNFFRLRTLRDKLRVVITLLMALSLLGSSAAFVVSTILTQNQLLRRQTEASSRQLTQALESRVRNLEAAAQLLANDPEVGRAVQDNNEAGLAVLNSRAVAIRERFELGLVQIYNADGLARTNLLLASLYRETSLLAQLPPGSSAVRVVNDQALLLSRAAIPTGRGDVILGLDLHEEIRRLLNRYRLSAELGLQFTTPALPDAPAVLMRIATSAVFPFDAPPGRSATLYKHQLPFQLGETPVDLLLTYSTTDIQQMATSGILVMLLSTAITTALLIALSMRLLRILVQPIQQISTAAAAVATGDLTHRIAIQPSDSWLHVGQGDEIALVADAFNRMVSDLQDSYTHLETRVAARTHELAVAAELARDVSANLDVVWILQTAAQTIRRQLGYYRVSVFLLDAAARQLALYEVSGEAGPYAQGYTIPLQPDTLVGAAALMHTACVVPDVTAEQRFAHDWLPQSRSGVAVPLLFGQEVFGVLEIQSQTENDFPIETLNLLNTLADQVAMGLHNAQQYAAEQKRRRLAELLELTGRVLVGSLNLTELPGRALSALKALLPHDRSSLWMAEGELLQPLAQYGYSDELRLEAKRLTVQGDLYQRLSAERQPLIIADIAAAPQWQQRPWLPGDRAWLGVPILSHDKVVGMVCLSRNVPDAFSAEDAMWVQSFAAQVGIALENAGLYARLTDLNARLTQAQKRRMEEVYTLPEEWVTLSERKR